MTRTTTTPPATEQWAAARTTAGAGQARAERPGSHDIDILRTTDGTTSFNLFEEDRGQHLTIVADYAHERSELLCELLSRARAAAPVTIWGVEAFKGSALNRDLRNELDWCVTGEEGAVSSMAAALVRVIRDRAAVQATEGRSFQPTSERPAIIVAVDTIGDLELCDAVGSKSARNAWEQIVRFGPAVGVMVWSTAASLEMAQFGYSVEMRTSLTKHVVVMHQQYAPYVEQLLDLDPSTITDGDWSAVYVAYGVQHWGQAVRSSSDERRRRFEAFPNIALPECDANAAGREEDQSPWRSAAVGSAASQRWVTARLSNQT